MMRTRTGRDMYWLLQVGVSIWMSTRQCFGGITVLIVSLLLMNMLEQRLNDNDLDGFPFVRSQRLMICHWTKKDSSLLPRLQAHGVKM